jgi:dihydrofolate reductase
LAQSLTELGLIDEYRIYLHPVVLGHGKPYFAGPRPPLRLMTKEPCINNAILRPAKEEYAASGIG